VRIGAAIVTFMAISGTGLQGNITGFYYHSQPGDVIGRGEKRLLQESTGFIVNAVRQPFPAGFNGIDVIVAGGAGELWQMQFGAPLRAEIKVGAYDGAVRFGPHDGGPTAGIGVSRDILGCNTVRGRLEVLEVAYAPDRR